MSVEQKRFVVRLYVMGLSLIIAWTGVTLGSFGLDMLAIAFCVVIVAVMAVEDYVEARRHFKQIYQRPRIGHIAHADGTLTHLMFVERGTNEFLAMSVETGDIAKIRAGDKLHVDVIGGRHTIVMKMVSEDGRERWTG